MINFKHILIAILLLFPIAESVSASQITIDTNQESFAAGDTIEISGNVEDGKAGGLVAIEVKDPSGETVMIRTAELDSEGSFDMVFKIPSSGVAGSYSIIANAQVGGEAASGKKTVYLSQEASTESKGGGCLIATATFGSELSPQVQQLRELRDNKLLQTSSGTSFMAGFNSFYYSFSPTIADMERENPVFREAVKLTITPLLTSLSLLNYIDINSEEKVVGYGIGIILLNIGMYFVAPAILVHSIRRKVI